MKKLLLLLSLFIGLTASGQSIYQLQQDSIVLGKSNGTSSVTVPGKLNLKGLPKGNISIKANGQVIHNDTLYATIAGGAPTVNTIEEMIAYTGAATAIIVKDTLRGGVFAKVTGMVVDTGIVFPGQWKRLGNTAIADAKWYGVHPDSTMNGLRLNNATHSPYVSTLNINFPGDTILVETPVYIRNRSGFVFNPGPTLKHPNEVPYALSATAAPGDTIIYITNADKKFLVNQTIGLYSTNAPIVGTEAGENWPRMSASRIKRTTPTYVVLDSAIRDGYNTDSAAVARNLSNLIIVENATNVEINSPKLDGNKANAFYGYPMTRQTESDIANNGISLIGSTDVAINNIDIINTNLNGMKWTRNNYRVYATGGEIKNPNGKGIVANYGGGDLHVNSMLVDSSRYNDGINFNGDINGYTLNNVYVEDVRTRRNGRWGVRAQGSQTRMYIKGLTSNNDGGVVQTEGADSKITQLTWHSPQDFRCGCNTVEAAVRIGGARTIIDGFSADSIGVPANMFRFEIANFKVMNGFISNMPSAVSSGKTIYRGLAGATNGQILNITYDNVDQTKIFRNTSGGAYFGDLTTSGVTVSMSDRPNFSGSTTARNRFGNYSSTGTLTFTDNTSVGDINLANPNTWTAAQVFSNTTFPVVIERSSSSFGLRFTRGGGEQGAWLFDASNVFTGRNATGNFMTVPSGSTAVTFPTAPRLIALASGTAGTDSLLVKHPTTNVVRRISPTYYAPTASPTLTGTVSANLLNITTDAATTDGMGALTITRTKPTGDWAYSGFTNTGRVAWGKGIAANNRLIWGTGPLRGTSATIDTIKMSLSTSGDLVVNGKFKSQHLVGVVLTDSVAGIDANGNLVRFAPNTFPTIAANNVFTGQNRSVLGLLAGPVTGADHTFLSGSTLSFVQDPSALSGTLQSATITSTSKTWTLPDATGTIALTATTPTITSGAVAPASTPGKIGDIYIDTVARKMYFAVGSASSADWEIAN